VNDRERDNQIQRARVLEVRIHLPPAESRLRTRFLQRRVRGLLSKLPGVEAPDAQFWPGVRTIVGEPWWRPEIIEVKEEAGGQPELLLQGSREDAAHRVPLPAGGARHLVNGGALGSLQHRDHCILL
jgi:hypothetical protein